MSPPLFLILVIWGSFFFSRSLNVQVCQISWSFQRTNFFFFLEQTFCFVLLIFVIVFLLHVLIFYSLSEHTWKCPDFSLLADFLALHKLRQSFKLLAWILNTCSNIYTKLLGKSWETYWFQAFKNISIQLLVNHSANQTETSEATQVKEYRRYRVSWGKSLIKQIVTSDNKHTPSRIWFRVATLYYLKSKIFNTCQETSMIDIQWGKHSVETGPEEGLWTY